MVLNYILVGCPWLGSLSNNHSDGYKNVTSKVNRAASNLNRRLFHLVRFVKFWSCVLKDCIKVQEKEKKVVVLSSRPPQNVKMLTFSSKSWRDEKKSTKKRDGRSKLLFCQSKNIVFFPYFLPSTSSLREHPMSNFIKRFYKQHNRKYCSTIQYNTIFFI